MTFQQKTFQRNLLRRRAFQQGALQTRRSLLVGGAALFSLGLITQGEAHSGHHLGRVVGHAGKKAPITKNTQNTVSDIPATTPIGPVQTLARWACVLDDESGAVLLDKHAHEAMPPSSLTKMMTAYVTFGMLRVGRLKLDQMLPVSERAYHMGGSSMFLKLGQYVAVKDLIQGMVIQSGNDACIVLAEGIAGSEESFVVLMNDTASKLGLKTSHFMNATGLPAENHYMSAYDVAYLALRLIHDFPEYYHFFSEKEFTFNGIRQENRNTLVVRGLADGLKTGHTNAGGFGLCASSLREGRRVIVAVNGLPSAFARISEGDRLLQWAFANFETAEIVQRGEVVDQAPVWMGNMTSVPLVAGEGFKILLPHGWQKNTHMSLDYTAPLPAPLLAGEEVGQLTVTLPDNRIAHIPVVVGQTVTKLGFLGRVARRLHVD